MKAATMTVVAREKGRAVWQCGWRSRLCTGGQWQGGRGSGGNSNGYSRGGGLMAADGGSSSNDRGLRHEGTLVGGKRRRQRPTMGGSEGWQLELAMAAVKKNGGWLRLGGRGWVALEGEEMTALDPTVGSSGGGDAGEERHD
ncbi:hypothetical protein B296_00044244 [Ensete ventricosum]|uniref:Uncharacterized protein n=1 Tax=Ensete ventricosum TaxID=4639 RepID=A0A426X7R9_ENSVE|nr:hypothetical protein B296_00044244 [Ensete ventricosum]